MGFLTLTASGSLRSIPIGAAGRVAGMPTRGTQLSSDAAICSWWLTRFPRLGSGGAGRAGGIASETLLGFHSVKRPHALGPVWAVI